MYIRAVTPLLPVSSKRSKKSVWVQHGALTKTSSLLILKFPFLDIEEIKSFPVTDGIIYSDGRPTRCARPWHT